MGYIKYNTKMEMVDGKPMARAEDGGLYFPIFSEKGNIYVFDYETENLMAINSDKITDEIMEIALFNYVSADNMTNPAKSGVYHIGLSSLKDAFSDAMFKIEQGNMTAYQFKINFALYGKNEHEERCLTKFANIAVNRLAKVVDEVETL